MLSKLKHLFLWTCTALFLGLVTILGMSAIKGNFNLDTLTKIVALLNGIDIQGERLRKILEEGRAAADPDAENLAAALPQDVKPLSTLQADLRSASLDRYKKELDDRAQRLKEQSDKHNALVAEFKKTLADARVEQENASMLQIKEILEALDPAVAKEQIITMLEKEQKGEVLAIFKVLDADKLKKILGEFVDPADQQKIAEILEEIRVRGKLASIETS